MSRPRFLADHDLNEHIVQGVLRRESLVTFIRARDVAMSDRPDSELLKYAAREGLIVVSHDVNTMPAEAFSRIAEGRPLPGLLMVHQSAPIGAIIEDIIAIWSASEGEEWANHVSFLPLS